MERETEETKLIRVLDEINANPKHVSLSHEEFIKRAVLKLRDVTKSRGIHSVFSGFNQAFRLYFGDENPVEVTQTLARIGKIEIRPVRRGVMIYLPGEAPKLRENQGEQALKTILED